MKRYRVANLFLCINKYIIWQWHKSIYYCPICPPPTLHSARVVDESVGRFFFFPFQFVSHQSSQLVWWMSDKREGGRFCNCNWKCWKVPKRSSARKATAEKQQAKQLKKNRKQRWNDVKTKKKNVLPIFLSDIGGFFSYKQPHLSLCPNPNLPQNTGHFPSSILILYRHAKIER